MKDVLTQLLSTTLKELDLPDVAFTIEHPADLSHGDYATNVAFLLGGNPHEHANQIVEKLSAQLPESIERVSIAGSGFINFHLSDSFFHTSLEKILHDGKQFGRHADRNGEHVMVEYTDPNPFKQFHIGHLMTNAIGEALARAFEWNGATVIRVNYQGDAGPHVAKALFGMQALKENMPSASASLSEKVAFLGGAYAFGNQAYERDPAAQADIHKINQAVYEHDAAIWPLYETGRAWSLEHFESIYRTLGTRFDHYIFESEVAQTGKEIVQQHLGTVFELSDGAVVYRGEKVGLHTRVFITANGLPTYEAKELGNFQRKAELEPTTDTSIIVTANEQQSYMQVVLAALSQIAPKLAQQVLHVTHGMMTGIGGKKMSSRTGDVITGEGLLREVAQLAEDRITASGKGNLDAAEAIAVAAIKYMILKQGPGKDITYNPEAILSFEGDSGPYLQYTCARIQSLLNQTDIPTSCTRPEAPGTLERLLYRFEEVTAEILVPFAPQNLVTYLIEVAQAFNTYYGSHKILGEENTPYRLLLAQATATVLKNGMAILAMPTVDEM